VDDGTSCGDGAATCQAGNCIGTFDCSEAGIRHAIAVGGGPHTFRCGGPTTVVTEAEIIIDNDVILDAEGNLTVDAGYRGGDLTGEEHRVFSVDSKVTAELRGFTVIGGYGTWGGGIRNYSLATLTLKDSTVSGNSGKYIGGIGNGGALTLLNSTVSGNGAWAGVGGISSGGTKPSLTLLNSTVSGNSGQDAGGISNGGTLTMMNSSVSGNTSWAGVGGIVNSGYTASSSLTNSTVSGNTGSLCDGIDNEGRTSSRIVTMTNSTVLGENGSVCANVLYTGKTAGDLGLTQNMDIGAGGAGGGPGGGAAGTGGTGGGGGTGGSGGTGGYPGKFTLATSLILGDCDADISSNGYNVESPGNTCGFDTNKGDQVGVQDPMLGPLQDNGGPTETHALLPGSPAINRIPWFDCEVETDQRGEPRPGGTMCDVGAFEVQP